MKSFWKGRLFWCAYKKYPNQLKKFIGDFRSLEISDRICLLRNAFHGPDRTLGVMLLPYLDIEELEHIFDELIYLASFSHGGIIYVRNAIKTLPKNWIFNHIEEEVEKYLYQGDYEQYRRFLELYSEIDSELTNKLALRASQSLDFDIREAGVDFLNKDLKI